MDATGPDHCEAVVTLLGSESMDRLVAWAETHGLSVIPMRAGALVSGPARALLTAFGPPLEEGYRATNHAVPDALRDVVSSILIANPPDYTTPGEE